MAAERFERRLCGSWLLERQGLGLELCWPHAHSGQGPHVAAHVQQRAWAQPAMCLMVLYSLDLVLVVATARRPLAGLRSTAPDLRSRLSVEPIHSPWAHALLRGHSAAGLLMGPLGSWKPGSAQLQADQQTDTVWQCCLRAPGGCWHQQSHACGFAQQMKHNSVQPGLSWAASVPFPSWVVHEQSPEKTRPPLLLGLGLPQAAARTASEPHRQRMHGAAFLSP